MKKTIYGWSSINRRLDKLSSCIRHVRIIFDFYRVFRVALFNVALPSLKERSHRIMYEPKSFFSREIFFLVENIYWWNGAGYNFRLSFEGLTSLLGNEQLVNRDNIRIMWKKKKNSATTKKHIIIGKRCYFFMNECLENFFNYLLNFFY